MLALQLFGTFLATDNHQAITTFRSSRARALFAYLAVESRIPTWRDKLAALLWSDMPDVRARRNLSVTLTRLQDALDSYTPGIATHLFTSTPQTLQLSNKTFLQCDVWSLEADLAVVASHAHPHIHQCESCLATLATAVQRYQGEFLAGFGVAEAPLFEEWLTLTRELYHQKVMGALRLLTESALERHDHDTASHYAQQQLALEPWSEQAHYHYMRALVQQGERGKALHQFEMCRTLLAAEFGAAPGAELTVFYEQLQAGMEAIRPGAHPSGYLNYPGSHTLPAALNRFFGRETERDQLKTLLTTDDIRLVTVLGSGGMGKTRLATEVGRTVQEQFADGIWFISLVGVEAEGEPATRAALIRAIYEIMPIAPRPNMSAEALLMATLRPQQSLLILDNMEQLLEGASLISDLLRAAPYLTILCTSRAALKLQTEWLFPLGGLPVPSLSDTNADEEPEDAAASLQLFVARARQGVPTFTLNGENRASLRAICAGTYGSPLGIELAAAMMRYRTPTILAGSLQHSLDAIYSEQRDVEPRHRSLRAIFRTSWELLQVEERLILSRLSLFRSPFGAESAAAVAGATLIHLNGLMDQSLLNRVGTTHYELHVLVREYAAEQLIANGMYDVAYRAYLDYFLGLLSNYYPALLGMEPRFAMEQLYEVMEDIRAAWESAVTGGEIALLAQALPPLVRLLMMGNSRGGGGIYFEQDAIRLADKIGDEDNATTHLIGMLWVAAAQTTLTHAPLERVMAVGERIYQLAQCIDSLPLEAHSWRVKGRAHLLKGSSEQAESYFDRALALARRSRDAQLLVLCLAAYRTPLKLQRAYAEEALKFATALGDGWTIAQLQTNLGGAYYFDGALVQARESFRQAIAYYERSGHQHHLAMMLNNMGDVHRVLGQYEQAHLLHLKALQLGRSLGDRWNEQSVLEGMARYHRDMGDPLKGRTLVEAAIAIVTEMGIIISVAHHYNILGLTALELGDWEQAEQAFTDGIQLSSAGGHHQVLMESYAGMARLAQVHGQTTAVARWVDEIATFVLSGQWLGSYTDTAFIYWTCYEILSHAQDSRALLILERAYEQLEAVAATLPTPKEVAMFWRVPLRARLKEAAVQNLTASSVRTYSASPPN